MYSLHIYSHTHKKSQYLYQFSLTWTTILSTWPDTPAFPVEIKHALRITIHARWMCVFVWMFVTFFMRLLRIHSASKTCSPTALSSSMAVLISFSSRSPWPTCVCVCEQNSAEGGGYANAHWAWTLALGGHRPRDVTYFLKNVSFWSTSEIMYDNLTLL